MNLKAVIKSDFVHNKIIFLVFLLIFFSKIFKLCYFRIIVQGYFSITYTIVVYFNI